MINTYFQICSLFYSILLICIYFAKERVSSAENKIYIILAITNFIGLILDILSIFTITYMNVIPKLNTFVSKAYLIYLLTWMYLFTIYVFTVSIKNNKKEKIFKMIKFTCPIYLIFGFLVIIFKLFYVHDGVNIYSYGPAANVLYLVSLICIITWLILMIINYKELKNKKYLPMFAFLVIGSGVTIIQLKNPSLLLMTSMETFIIVLMYFTIENPDMKMIEQLNIAREQADKANNAKTDFLSSMSHEIRTPLNAIVGFSESLKEEELSDSAKDEVNDIISASQSLLEIVNGILDISKIEANKLEIINKEYDIHRMFKDLINLTKVRIGEKPIELKVNIDQSIPQVLYGDHTRVKQIILNLLTNAAKYTDKGYIEFNVRSVIKDEVCRLIISVKDTGKGIKQENIDKLFTKFERFDEKNSTIEGTGLGLAITKKLINLMGGNIVVDSVYQKGSNFMVSIDQAIVKNPTIIKEDQSKEQDVKTSYQDKKILIVDDNELNLKVAKRLLQIYEMQIDTVLSGDEAITKIKNNEVYDLILLDDMMPHKSGSETLVELRQIENFSIPVVVLTANAIEGMKEKYLEMGFDDYLAKPISKEELRRVLLKYLN